MTWLREMASLLKQWWRIEIDYRAAMRALKRKMKEMQ